MTGGQPLDGGLTVPVLTRQLAAEGVRRIVVVTDEPDKYAPGVDFAPGTAVRDRGDLDGVQRELREIEGVTALFYDQACAPQKRRPRKPRRFPDPAQRGVINNQACARCGGSARA